eukprot:963140-Karenia_brevis.AAC.1
MPKQGSWKEPDVCQAHWLVSPPPRVRQALREQRRLNIRQVRLLRPHPPLPPRTHSKNCHH